MSGGATHGAHAETERIVVGKIMTAFGVNGWVKIYSFTDPIENILEYGPWWVCCAGTWRIYPVVSGRKQGRSLVVQLQGCDDRNAALALRQADIAVPLDNLKVLDTDEYYWRDLVGCRVVNQQGEDLGMVVKLMQTGANDVMVLRIDAAAVPLLTSKGVPLKERLLPFVKNTVLRVDTQAALIGVDWPSDF